MILTNNQLVKELKDRCIRFICLFAHGAKNLLYEAAAIKGRKNEDYWRDLQFGIPPAPPNKNFVFDKMVTYLKGAGVNVEKQEILYVFIH
jgi:hypothetical protein